MSVRGAVCGVGRATRTLLYLDILVESMVYYVSLGVVASNPVAAAQEVVPVYVDDV